MMETEGMPNLFWRERWRLAVWVGPVLMLVVFAHQVVLPLAGKAAESRNRLSALKENTYEAAWLDSTQASLQADVDLLREFHRSRQAALARDSSIQGAVDRIRALAQGSGIEIFKTTPTIGRADSLSMLKVKMDGFTHFSGLLAFFTLLEAEHPGLYVEEMLIRQGGERTRGRLEAALVLHAYSEKGESGRAW